jgi:Uma2 family endonuclease
MPVLLPEKRYTIEDYFRLDEGSEVKLEFYNGNILPMSGGTPTHNKLALRIGAMLLQALEDQPFEVYNSDMKIYIPGLGAVVYPDAVVVAEVPQLYPGCKDVIVNPLLVAEISSPSTEGYDRGAKFDKYRLIPSFAEYLLLRQDRPWASVYTRSGSDTWQMRDVQGLEAEVLLQSLGIRLEMSRLYKGISFED